MNEEQALVMSIFEANGPRVTDHAPSLLYSDWLEERGRDAEAGLVRVECEIERKLFPALYREDAEMRELRAQRNQLRKAVTDGFVQALPESLRDRFRAGPLALHTYCGIRTLFFSEWDITDSDIANLSDSNALATVSHLHLDHNRFTDAGLASLLAPGVIGPLMTLRVWNNRLTVEAILHLAASPAAATLRTIGIGNGRITLFPTREEISRIVTNPDTDSFHTTGIGHFDVPPADAAAVARAVITSRHLREEVKPALLAAVGYTGLPGPAPAGARGEPGLAGHAPRTPPLS